MTLQNYSIQTFSPLLYLLKQNTIMLKLFTVLKYLQHSRLKLGVLLFRLTYYQCAAQAMMVRLTNYRTVLYQAENYGQVP